MLPNLTNSIRKNLLNWRVDTSKRWKICRSTSSRILTSTPNSSQEKRKLWWRVTKCTSRWYPSLKLSISRLFLNTRWRSITSVWASNRVKLNSCNLRAKLALIRAMFRPCKDTLSNSLQSSRLWRQRVLSSQWISAKASVPATSSSCKSWTNRSLNIKIKKSASEPKCRQRRHSWPSVGLSMKVCLWRLSSFRRSSKEKRQSATISLKPEPKTCTCKFKICSHLSK